jgi:hypothetical protein
VFRCGNRGDFLRKPNDPLFACLFCMEPDMSSGTSPSQGNSMPISSRASRFTAKPHRANAATIAILVFVVVEAIGIGYVLWTY